MSKKARVKELDLRSEFLEAAGSADPFLLIRTEDYEDVETVISRSVRKYEWDLWVWDARTGLQNAQLPPEDDAPKAPAGPLSSLPAAPAKLTAHGQAVAAIEALARHPNTEVVGGDAAPRTTVLLMRNLPRLWQEGGDPKNVLEVVQALQNAAKTFKAHNKLVVGVGTASAAPAPELAPLFRIVKHDIPRPDEFLEIIRGVDDGKLSDEQALVVAEASRGLTRLQAENAYGRAMYRLLKLKDADVDVGAFFCEVVEGYKNAILNADGTLSRWNGPETFDDIGGNDALKEYLKTLMSPQVRRRAAGKSPRLNAVTLIGPSGTGKTLAAKALGRHTGRKTYGANLSSQKNKWLGESEANARRMFTRASAMGNIVLYFDEFNEQIEGGEGEGHATDKALRQYLMEWLDTHHKEDDVFVVLTANAISGQHMGLYRRLGKIFYVGHPGKVQKQAIWQICAARHGLEPGQLEKLPDDQGWVGEDIDACCAFAEALQITVLEAARRHVIPSSNYTGPQVDNLRREADGVCFDAETGEVFRKDKVVAPDPTGTLGDMTVRAKRVIRRQKD